MYKRSYESRESRNRSLGHAEQLLFLCVSSEVAVIYAVIFIYLNDPCIQARKTFKIAWDPEFPRKIAFDIF